EGFTCFDLETAMSRPSGFAKSFEGILFVDCYHCPWDSPAFRFAAKSTPKKDVFIFVLSHNNHQQTLEVAKACPVNIIKVL
ncbi:hypothetical protein, partial [uncultured Mucilaginibacter sp.]|uniref:hypothetical protein n=1 Tax=uncultured Mucilaginibacter sp. TaxID=797541 RepID=UPI0025FF5113